MSTEKPAKSEAHVGLPYDVRRPMFYVLSWRLERSMSSWRGALRLVGQWRFQDFLCLKNRLQLRTMPTL